MKGQGGTGMEERIKIVKLVALLSALSLATALLIYFVNQLFSSRPTTGLPLSGQIVVLDPGHGGRDGGAVSRSGLVEKEITLSIALSLRDLLEQAGAMVIMTREDDRELASEEAHRQGRRKKEDLMNRVKLINRDYADLFVSIHLNSVNSSRWRGAQTFYNPLWPESERLARFIQDELIRNLENTNRVPKKNQEIFILRASKIPGVLVEVGFLSSPDEARLLSDAEYRRKIAFAIYTGILRYYSDENTLPFP
jgi:N-acetylmuramoyl-L-alanine amidase